MILKDRVSDIYQNYSVCENNCKYNKINLTDNIVSCNCSVKINADTEFEKPKLATIIRDSFTDSNLGVMKCFNLVFNFKNKINNIGFCIFTVLVIFHIPLFIYYFIFNISSIRTYIFSEMKKFHYSYNVINPVKKQNKKGNNNIKISNNKNTLKNEVKKSKIQNIIYTNKKEDKSKKNSLLIYKNKHVLTDNYYTHKSKFNKKDNEKNLNSKLFSSNKNMISIGGKNKKNNQQNILLVNYKIYNKNYLKIPKENNSPSKMKNPKEIKVNTDILSEKPIYSLIQIDAKNR